MGLSPSQGRFLTLTARKNNIEFQVQQLTQAKLQLADQQDTEAYLWSNGMNIQHLYYAADGNGSISDDLPRLSYQLCTKSASDGGLNMRVIDKYGRIVVSELPDPLPEGKEVGDYVIEKNCTQADYFEKNLLNGNWRLQQPSKQNETGWQNITLEGCENIYQGVDSKDYAVAEADYSASVERLERIEKRYDMQIQQLTNEQKAIETEMDSVKKVIDKNIEETFKTFG